MWSDGLDTTGSVTVTAPGGGSVPVTVTSEYGNATSVSVDLGHRLQPAHLRPGHLRHLPGGRHPHRRPHRGLRDQPGPPAGGGLGHRLAPETPRRPSTGCRSATTRVELEPRGPHAEPDRHPGRPPTINRIVVDTQSVGSTATGVRDYTLSVDEPSGGLDHGGHRGRPVPDPRAPVGLRPGDGHRGPDHRLRGRLRRLLRRGDPSVVVPRPRSAPAFLHALQVYGGTDPPDAVDGSGLTPLTAGGHVDARRRPPRPRPPRPPDRHPHDHDHDDRPSSTTHDDDDAPTTAGHGSPGAPPKVPTGRRLLAHHQRRGHLRLRQRLVLRVDGRHATRRSPSWA